MLKKIQRKFSQSSRRRRGKIFLRELSPTKDDHIIDLGGGDGGHLNDVLRSTEVGSVTIADISLKDLRRAEREFGYKTVTLNEQGNLPFGDKQFDIVFSNSVIEHVTLPKQEIWEIHDTEEFRNKSFARQKEFADEISRIGKAYFVQTPNKFYWFESHTWLPGIVALLPRSIQIALIRVTNKFWPKKTTPDWNLLTYKDMQNLFPEAEIHRVVRLGLTKSLIAIKTKESS